MKKKLAAVFAVILVGGLFTSVYAANKGDINADGVLDSKDAKAIQKYLYGKNTFTSTEQSAADLNSDGKINIADLILEKELILKDQKDYFAGPQFSKESGFYNSNFSLTLSAENGARIYYTTDGSVPTQSSRQYNGSISIYDKTSDPNVYSAYTNVATNNNFTPPNVTKGTVVRAIAVSQDGKVSDVVSKTYFVGVSIANQYNNFPVICVTADPDDLWSDEKGIYVTGDMYKQYQAGQIQAFGKNPWEVPTNYVMRGKEWERKVQMEIFEKDGQLAHSQDIGIRIAGNATRAYVVKTLKFYARDEYGKKNVKYDLIPGAKAIYNGEEIEKYGRFTMRNGGNDMENAMFRDNYIQSLVGDRAFATQKSRPAVMFINGEFFGVYVLMENYSDDYLATNYGVNKDNVVLIECGKEVDEGNEEDLQLWKNLIQYATNNDLTVNSNYQQIQNMMDLQSFIDYQCTQIFIANQDYTINNNNYRTWRSRDITDNPYEDGKWRWMLYDTEYSMNLYGFGGNTATEDSLQVCLTGNSAMFGGMGGFGGGMGGWGGQQQPAQQQQQQQQTGNILQNVQPKEHTMLFYKLLQNSDFKQRFVTTFCDMLSTNFERQHILDVLDQFENMYRPVVGEHMSRVKSPNGGWGGMGGFGGGDWGGMDFGGGDWANMDWGNMDFGGQGGQQWNMGGMQQGDQQWNQQQGGQQWNMGGMQQGDQQWNQQQGGQQWNMGGMQQGDQQWNMGGMQQGGFNMGGNAGIAMAPEIGFVGAADDNSSNVSTLISSWESQVESIRSFVSARGENVYSFLQRDLGLGSLSEVTVSVNNPAGGTVIVNTAKPDLSRGSWTGKYFTDYPVTLTAVPAEGYVFAGWEGVTSSTSATITGSVGSGITARAKFTKR